MRLLRFSAGALFSLFLFGTLLSSCDFRVNEPTVCMVTDSATVNDRGYNLIVWRAIVSFYEDSSDTPAEKRCRLMTAGGNRDLASVLIEASESEPDLIILTSLFVDSLRRVAPQYPKQKYMILDTESTADLPANVLVYVFDPEESSYLVGAMAALQARSEGVTNPRFGFFGGIAQGVILDFESGFSQGVHAVLPDSEVVDHFALSFDNREAGKETASLWFDEGVYAVYAVAGRSGLGVIEEAKERVLSGQKAWVLGVDVDQFREGLYEKNKSVVLTSMKKHVEKAVQYSLKAVRSGTFRGGVAHLGLQDACVSYTLTNPQVSQDAVRAVRKMEEEILSGKRLVQRRNQGGFKE